MSQTDQLRSISTENGELREDDVCELITEEIQYTGHLSVWLCVNQLDRKGVYPINPAAVHPHYVRRVGVFDDGNTIRRRMERLVEIGLLERIPRDDHPNGYHWKPNEMGHFVADELAYRWVKASGRFPEIEETIDERLDEKWGDGGEHERQR